MAAVQAKTGEWPAHLRDTGPGDGDPARPTHQGHHHAHGPHDHGHGGDLGREHDEHADDDHGHHHHAFDRLEAARIVVAGLCAVALWFEDAVFFAQGSPGAKLHDLAAALDPWPVLALVDVIPTRALAILPPGLVAWIDAYAAIPFSTYAAVGLGFSAWPIIREALHDLRERRMTMELSMTIAILAAGYTGYFFPAMMITFFVLVAEVLEGMTLERGRRAIHDLLETLPREVTVRHGPDVARVATDTLTAGEIVLVGPGERIAVDGNGAVRAFLRRREPDHRRIHAGRETGRRRCLCRLDQPVGAGRGRGHPGRA